MNLVSSGCIPEQHKLEVNLRFQRSKLVLAAEVFKTSSAAQSLTTAGPNDVLEEPSASVHSIALLRNGCLLAAFLAKSAAWRSCVLKH